MRKLIRKLMMLNPGYRKACFLEQKLERAYSDLKAAIEAARPADRTDELRASIELAIAAARPVDRTDELKAAIEAARPADRTDEIKVAIEAVRPTDRTDEIKAAIEAARPADRTDELRASIESAIAAARPVDRTDELKAAIEAARPADRTDELRASIESAIAAARPVDRTDELKAAIEAARPADRTDELRASIESAIAASRPVDRTDELKAAIEAARPADRTDELKADLDAVKVALFKNDIRCRWQILDALDGMLYPPTMMVKCLVCGHEAAKSTYETKVSECIFGGGRLERFVCPECGCIFGPLKMMALSCTQLAEEYKQSYSVYSESDCTMLEKMAFEALHPEKGKKYLNYGAGAWNRTTKDLRAEGYDVCDFEPYALAESNPWVIRSIDELRKQKFDGIFSNDLIEHLRNPVEDLKAMKKLLKPGAGMAHCSGCYEYAFEYTRFHLFFLTGGSLERLCEETGLIGELSDRLFDYSPARICVFRGRDGRRE